jgi:uncharacterized protein
MIPLDILKDECTLSWWGIHGVPHWRRVNDIGLKLAPITGARIEIVTLFAYLHDLKRQNDGSDHHHGRRAAEYIKSIQESHLFLPQDELDILCYACEYHTFGLTEADITVQTCWDVDRLDLGRIGIRPDKRLLCTEAAKDPEIIKWACVMSQR